MAGCGTCTAADNPVYCTYPDNSTYTIGVSSSRLMSGAWAQASFPNVPCPSPQIIYWEWYNPSLGAWKSIPTTGTGTDIELTGTTNSKLANAGTTYNRYVRYFTPGTYQLRIHMACGAAFVSVTRTQVVVAPAAGGPPKMIHTQASIL